MLSSPQSSTVVPLKTVMRPMDVQRTHVTSINYVRDEIIQELRVSKGEPPAGLRPQILAKLPTLIPLSYQRNQVPFQETELILSARQIRVQRPRQLRVPLRGRRYGHRLRSTRRG